jgi:hypothetical protein
MLIQESYKDVATQDGGSMRIFTFHPQIPNYPKAKFPGVVVFSEIYQGKQTLGWKVKAYTTVSRMQMVHLVESALRHGGNRHLAPIIFTSYLKASVFDLIETN